MLNEPSPLAANSPVGLNGVLGKELAETKQVPWQRLQGSRL